MKKISRKKASAITIVTLVLAITILFSIEFRGDFSSHILKAEEVEYSLIFNSSKNRFITNISGEEIDMSVQTESDTILNFSYKNISSNNESWGTIESGGYFFNKEPINGLKSIAFDFVEEETIIYMSYGWISNSYFDFLYQDVVIETSVTNSFSFGSTYPNLVQLSCAEAAVRIETITLTYSCQESTSPYFGSPELTYAYHESSDSYEVTGSSNVDIYDVIIPKRHLGKPVTRIGDNAFRRETSFVDYYANIRTFDFDETITYIGDYAFLWVIRLKEITIHENVTYIGKEAFNGCISLTIFSKTNDFVSTWDLSWNANGRPVIYGFLRKGMYSNLKYAISKLNDIEAVSIYQYNDNFVEISFPREIENLPLIRIERWAFYALSSLRKIFVPSCIETIGSFAFNTVYNNLEVYAEALSKPSGWQTFSMPSGVIYYWGASEIE